jgi:hypothetical protein
MAQTEFSLPKEHSLRKLRIKWFLEDLHDLLFPSQKHLKCWFIRKLYHDMWWLKEATP